MPGTVYGYRSGPRVPVQVKIDSGTSAISVGDFLALGTAGYYQQAAAGDTAHCVAMEAQATISADGDATILADFSTLSVYEYPPDTGTVTQALVGTTMDVGGAQSINIDASTDDCVRVVRADTVNNTVYIQLVHAFAGVV